MRTFLDKLSREQQLDEPEDGVDMALTILDQHLELEQQQGRSCSREDLPSLSLAALMLANKLLCHAQVSDWEERIAKNAGNSPWYGWASVEKAERMLFERIAGRGLCVGLPETRGDS